MEYTKFTEQEFKESFGIVLSQAIPSDDDESTTVERKINDIVEQIQEYIQSQMIGVTFDDISVAQNTYINRACMEQLFYVIKHGDISRESGIDAYNQTVMAQSELDRRVIAPRAKDILASHIITKGFY
jgi:hypothetical protein